MNKIFCRMGENYAFIKPNGDVERCCKDHSMSLGNVIKGTFKLLEEAKECKVEDCYCWRRMIVGKDDEWSKYWGETWDQFYCDEIRKIVVKLNNNDITFNEACEKFIVFKQKIYDKNTREEEINVLENNIISKELNIGWEELEKDNLELAVNKSEQLLKYCDVFNPLHKIYILIYNSRLNMLLNDFKKAKDYLLQIKAIDQTYSAMYKLLAMIEFELGNYNESKINFKKAIKFAKKNNDRKELIEIYFEIVVCLKKYYNTSIDFDRNKCLNFIDKLQKKISEYKQ